MASDFNIAVGFDTGQLQSAMSGGAPNGGSDSGGGMKVFGMLNIIEILKQMKAVTDSASFVLMALSTGFVYLLSLFYEYITPFFKDPVRFLLPGWITMANLIVGAVEFMTNLLLMGLNKINPFGEEEFTPVEFGRFRTDVILSAYDNMKDTIFDQESSISDITEAVFNFGQSFIEGFMTNEEYAGYLATQSEESMIAIVDSMGGVQNVAVALNDKAIETVKFMESIEIGSRSYRSGGSISGGISGASTRYDKNFNIINDTETYNSELKFVNNLYRKRN